MVRLPKAEIDFLRRVSAESLFVQDLPEGELELFQSLQRRGFVILRVQQTDSLVKQRKPKSIILITEDGIDYLNTIDFEDRRWNKAHCLNKCIFVVGLLTLVGTIVSIWLMLK